MASRFLIKYGDLEHIGEMRVHIDLKDTDETIYKSPILTVGSHLNNITLDSDLPTGVYDCIVTYHLLDEKDESFDTVSLNLTINIGQ